MYYATSNLFQAVISGNTLQVTGLSAGSGSLSVCSSGGSASGCATLYVTVGGTNYNYNNNYGNNYYNGYNNPVQQSAITFSQTNPALSIGQSMSVALYGGTTNGYYNGS